jgi:predicted phage tail protein
MQVAASYAPIRVIYGTVRLGAQVVNVVDYGGYWYVQVVWGEGPITAISAVMFNDADPNDPAKGATCVVTNYSGTSGQLVNADLVAAFAAKGVVYTDTLPDIAYSVLRISKAGTSGMPTVTALIQGRAVYDPRTTLTAYSDNPALIVADFVTNSVYGMGLTVDWPSVTTVANLCDAIVGSEKRRRLSLALDTVQPVSTWLDTLATYAGCWALKEGTKVTLIPDSTVGVSRTYAHASGQIAKLTALKQRGIAAMPTAIEIRYTDTTAIPWKDASQWAYLPGVLAGTYPRRESQIALPGIQSPSQAYREAVERLNKLTNADLSCTLEVFDESLDLQPGDRVQVTHPIGLTAKDFRVQRVTSNYGRHKLDLLEYDPSVYSNAIVVGSSTPNTLLPDPMIPPTAITGLAAVETIYKAGDGTVSSRLSIAWDTLSDIWQIRYSVTLYRMDDAIGGGLLKVINGYSDVNSFVFAPLEDNYYYRVEVIAERVRTGVQSAVATTVVQALGKLLPPANVTGFTATAGKSGLVLNWSPVVDIDMKGYRLKSGSWAGTTLYDVTSTSVNLGYVVAGTTNYYIKALDFSGNESTATATVSSTITAPVAVTGLSSTVDTATVLLTWNPSSAIWPIDRYEVRYGTSWAAGTTVATLNDTNCRVSASWAGSSRTFWVSAYDAAGNISTASSRAVALTKYSPVTTLGVTLLGADLKLTWSAATGGSLMLDCYEIRVGSTFAGAELLGTSSTTAFTIPYRWSANQTFWIAPRDMLGNNSSGTEASSVFNYSLPAAPAVASKLIGVKAELTWTTPSAILPVAKYSVRYGASWAAGAATEVLVAVTSLRVAIDWVPGTRTYYVAAIDVNGNVGTASVGTGILLNAPYAPTIDTVASSVGGVLLDQYRLAWDVITPDTTQVPIDYYVIGYDAVTLDRTFSSTYMATADWSGTRTFWVKAVDVLGNIGPDSSQTLTINIPTAPSITSQVIDNNVLLYWAGSTATLPIATYELRKGASWAGGSLIGQKSGGFTTVLETAAGTYTYWVAAIDSAGNVGTPSSLVVSVSQPPDYILNTEWTSNFGGTKVNATVDTDGSYLFGVDTTETWQSHFTSRTWAGPNDQVTDSTHGGPFPYYIQPGLQPASYTETFNYGAILPGTKVTVLTAGAAVSGTPVVSITISTSPDSTTWTDYPGLSSVYATNFQYVKVALTFTGGIYDLSLLRVTLDSKIKNAAGSKACLSTDILGTAINFNVEFVDVSAINITPLSTTAVTAMYDYLDAYVAGTYSVVSNVCTVTTGSVHGLVVGQNVKLTTSTGTGISAVYTVVTRPSSTQFTVAMTTANTSGNLTTYAQGFRVYLFDAAGTTRLSKTVSWAVRGY